MSGIIGHMTYAILAGKAAVEHKLPVAPIIHQHYASYLAGSYLGCDVQTLPAAVCRDTGQEVGYGSVPLKNSPVTGGAVTPWTLRFEGAEHTPHDVHQMFYGRAHLAFGFSSREREQTVPWDDLPGYLAAVVGDAVTRFGPGQRQLAYLFGWMTHVVGDGLIKSVRPAVTLHLLDGKYTPRNRPIQDLVSFHEIGRKELGLDWPGLLADLVRTPVEAIQPHYMRVARPRGQLAAYFPDGWVPRREPLLKRVLAENRRYQQIRNGRLLEQLELKRTPGGWQCDEELSRTTGGLTYEEMVELADKADFRHALWQIAEAIIDLFVQVIQEQPLLHDFPIDTGPTWKEISRKWLRD